MPPLPGHPGAAGGRGRAHRGAVLRRDGAAAAGRPARGTTSRCYLNLDFLDGTRGAHVNISGISGVATKTSYATFLLYSLFESGVLGPRPSTRRPSSSTSRARTCSSSTSPNTGWTTGRPPATRASACPSARSRAWPSSPRPAAAMPTPVPDVASRDTGVTLVLLDAGRVLPATSCCRSSSPTPRTTASSTRWSSTTSPPGCASGRAGARDGAVQHRRRTVAHVPRAGRRSSRPG